MPQDPIEEWRRLTALYSEMGDLEIQELAGQINDLTPNAQQILRDEMKKRGVTNETSSGPAPSSNPASEATVNWEPASYRYQFDELPDENDGPHEYTWKVSLCACDTTVEARRIAEMLRRAGIDSWIEAPEIRGGTDCPRVLVGADQFDQAQLVVAHPIPQDILDEESEREEASAYEIPVCPKCKALDPTLESVEPSNNWLCESCGYTWSDPVADPSQTTGSSI
jgi:hypothetical protein